MASKGYRERVQNKASRVNGAFVASRPSLEPRCLCESATQVCRECATSRGLLEHGRKGFQGPFQELTMPVRAWVKSRHLGLPRA